MSRHVPCDPKEFALLWATDMTCEQVGQHWGCGKTWASSMAARLQLPPRATSSARLPWAAMEQAYSRGLSCCEIREQLLPSFPLLSVSTVQRGLRQRLRTLRPPGKVVPQLHAECVRLVRQGLQYDEIGRRLGLSESQVGTRVRKILGARARGSWARAHFDYARALAQLAAGQPVRVVAASAGVSRQTIYYHCRKAVQARVRRRTRA